MSSLSAFILFTLSMRCNLTLAFQLHRQQQQQSPTYVHHYDTVISNGNFFTSSSSTSLQMKVQVNIDIDLPNFDLPQNMMMINPQIPTEISDKLSFLDSNTFSSFTSFLAIPTSSGDVFTTNGILGDINNFINVADMNTILPLSTMTQYYSSSSTTTSSTLGIIIGTILSTTFVVSSLLFSLSFPPDDFRNNHEPYERGYYDPEAAREYYAKHPLLVIRRFLQLLRIANQWIIRWILDQYLSTDSNNINTKDTQKVRAQELVHVIQKLGPTAIKVGQALSVRPDIIPETYTEALSELQDNVPPFDSDEAKAILIRELGKEKHDKLLKHFDFDNPVASASIGQVYRGVVRIKNEYNVMEDVEVAVKVQRPNVLSEIALDIFLAREIAHFYQKFTMNGTNLQKMADEWGRGFIAELTYEQEAENTIRFNHEMKKRNLNAVCAPEIVEELSSDRVLTTQWVKGVRLDRSSEDDVARLCGVALNAYLVMLLETGTLHCDPHPGNLLRTDDGRLCILDFGMTLETPEDLQYSLLEFIAHLTSKNYDAIPQDLVNLHFLKQDKLQLCLDLGLLEPMLYFFKHAADGGGSMKATDRIMDEYRQKYPGCSDEEVKDQMRREIMENTEKLVAKASSVSGITMKIEDLQREHGDAFVIPEWFLYASRAFLTLEGISLQADPNFSIIKSCFPYIAKRLIGDDSPRSQAALKHMLYGEGEYLNTDKMTELAGGFTTYTTTTKIVSQGGKPSRENKSNKAPSLSSTIKDFDAEAAITLAKDSADIILHPTGNLIQKLLLEESATALHANMKDTLRELLIDSPERIRATLPFGFLIPKMPAEQVALFLQKSQREERVQTLLKRFPFPQIPSPQELGDVIKSVDRNNPLGVLIDGMSPEEVALIWKALRENGPVYAPRVADLSGKLASSIFGKVGEDIDRVINATDESFSIADTLIRTSAKGISAAAKAAARAGSEKRK